MLCNHSQIQKAHLALIWGILIFIALGAAPPATAHVGDSGPIQAIAVNAGAYDLLATMTIPTALPGPLLLTVTAESGPAPQALDVRLTRYGSPFPADPAATLTFGAPLSTTTSLNLDSPGDWEIELRAQGDHGEGLARIPITVTQPPLPPTTIPLAVALGALVMSLLGGATVGAGGRASQPGFAGAIRALNYVAFASSVAAAIFAWQQFTAPTNTLPITASSTGGLPHVNLLLAADPPEPVAGRPMTLTLDLRDGATGLSADDFAPHHEALLHLAVIDDSGAFFAHVHPARIAPGLFEVTITPDRPGSYTAYAELARHGGGLQVVTGRIAVGGEAHAAATPAPGPGIREIDGLRIEVGAAPETLRAGQLSTLSLIVSNESGPVRTLEPWLGMGGHLLMRRADGSLFSHIHAAAPMAAPGSTLTYGPELRFVHNFPRAGTYQAWFQFRYAGQIITVPVTLEVGA